ncbi:MAG: choice-of-anchor D domain-containing protein [Myxococcales bacterium]|nr:choice-of-anchor D domain-containing protein [Myxococcales bacterium]
MMRNLFVALLLVAGASTAKAAPTVAVCAADMANGVKIQGLLAATNAFAKVDFIDCQLKTPTVAEMKAYQGIIFWDNNNYPDKAAMGNNAADYIDAGGGVVQAMFNLYTNYNLLGKFSAGGYTCINPGNSMGGATLKPAANEPNSPLAQGVMTLTSANYSTGGLAMGATSVWDYNQGQPAIARCAPGGHARVDVNFWPGGAGGDYVTVMKNALLFVSGGFSPLSGDPASLAFPDTGTGAQSLAKTVTYTNKGMGQANITALAIAGTNAGDFVITAAPQLPLSIAVGATFTVSVAFKPTMAGMRSAKLAASVQGAMGTGDVSLTGNGVPAKLVVTPNPINVGGAKVGQSTTPITVNISNAGGGQLTITNAVLGGPQAAEFKVTMLPGFPVKLGPGASFDLKMSVTPLQPGLRSATLTVTSDDANAPNLVVQVSGFGGDPKIDLDVGTMAFGNVRVGTMSAMQNVTVTNLGGADLNVKAMMLAGANPQDFTIASMALPGKVLANGTAKFSVVFKPSVLGQRQAQVVIMSDDVNNPTKFVGLIGTGTTSNVSLMPAGTLDFGNQKIYNASIAKTVTLTNAGGDFANVVSVTFSGTNGMWFALSNPPAFPAKVPAMNGTLPFAVVTQPLALGKGSGVMTIMTDDPKTPKFDIPLSVNGIGGSVSLSPNFIDFGAVAVKSSTKPMPIVLTNIGTDDINVTMFELTGDDPEKDFFVVNPPMPMLPLVLKPGGKMNFDVTFKPQMAQLAHAVIVLATDDPKAKLIKIPLAGLGAVNGINVSPMNIAFGSVQVGGTAGPYGFVITNTGDAPLTVSKVELMGASPQAYMIDQTGPFNLDGKGSQKVNVTFNPLTAGALNASVSITATGFPPVNVVLTGTGSSPSIGVGPDGLDFATQAIGTVSDPQTVLIANGGSLPVVVANVASGDPSFLVEQPANKMLAPKGQTSFTVRFAPKEMGVRLTKISINLQGGVAAARTIDATGAGVTSTKRPGSPGNGCSTSSATSRGGWPLGLALAVLGLALALRARRRNG